MKKYNIYPVLYAIILVSGLLLSACRNKEDDEEFLLYPETMDGAFMFTSATFLELTDLDGDGVRQPTSDALECLYYMIDIYADCPSEEETVFEFDPGGDLKYFYHYCGVTGQSRQLGTYSYIHGTNARIINIDLFEINDPGGLYGSKIIILDIDQCNRVDDAWIIQGVGAIHLTAYPEKLRDFSYELKEVVIE